MPFTPRYQGLELRDVDRHTGLVVQPIVARGLDHGRGATQRVGQQPTKAVHQVVQRVAGQGHLAVGPDHAEERLAR